MRGHVGVIDDLVGRRIEYYRLKRKVSRRQLAARVGVRENQIYKYERGINWVSAGRLFRIALVLRVPIALFFTEEDTLADYEKVAKSQKIDQTLLSAVRALTAIDDLSILDAVNHLARVLARRT